MHKLLSQHIYHIIYIATVWANGSISENVYLSFSFSSKNVSCDKINDCTASSRLQKRSVLTLVTNKFCLEERKGPSIVNYFELNFRSEINSTYFNKRADLAIGNLFILAFLRNMVSTQQAFTLLYKGLVSMLDEIVP